MVGILFIVLRCVHDSFLTSPNIADTIFKRAWQTFIQSDLQLVHLESDKKMKQFIAVGTVRKLIEPSAKH